VRGSDVRGIAVGQILTIIIRNVYYYTIILLSIMRKKEVEKM